MRRLFVPAAILILLFTSITVPGQERDLERFSIERQAFATTVGAGLVPARLASITHGQGQALPLQRSPPYTQSKTALELTASIKGQQACSVNANVDALHLTLQLRYTNTGRRKLILYKGNRFFFQIFISSRGGEDAASGRSELRTTHSRFFDEQPEKIASPNPGSVFTMISPGASYETTQLISLPVARAGEGVFNVSIAAGEHVLTVAASTWYESQKLGGELRKRWRPRGLLWLDPLVSNSITFDAGKERSTVACQ